MENEPIIEEPTESFEKPKEESEEEEEDLPLLEPEEIKTFNS